jgi:hypothetical protein
VPYKWLLPESAVKSTVFISRLSRIDNVMTVADCVDETPGRFVPSA